MKVRREFASTGPQAVSVKVLNVWPSALFAKCEVQGSEETGR